MNNRVKINTDTYKEIAELYDVGSQLAKRIVDYRQNSGYFRKPEDLAKVKGISLNLAIVLSPHIDWQVPESTDPPRKPKWSEVLTDLLGIIVSCWVLVKIAVPSLRSSITAYSFNKELWYPIWINASLVAANIVLLFIGCGVLISALIRNPARYRKFNRKLLLLFIPLLISIVSTGLGNAIYYQFYSPNSWSNLVDTPAAVIGLILGVTGFIIMGMALIILRQPKLVYSLWLNRLNDLMICISVPISIIGVWVIRESIPIWLHSILGLIGLVLIKVGYDSIRKGSSLLEISFDYLDPFVVKTRTGDERGAWLAWINARLPNPEEQIALKRALDEAYPYSRKRVLINIIVLGGGGWLIVTALGAVVEWSVQNWLGKIFR